MPTLLTDHIAASGESIALADDAGRLTWRELGERVDRWVGLFTALGLGEGDRLACVLGNRRETYEVLLACLHTGLTLVPVNWHLTAPEIAYILDDSQSRAVITERAYAPVVADAVAGCGHRMESLVAGHTAVSGLRAAEPLLAGVAPGVPGGPAREICGSTMLYTSGTTGAPKGVLNGMFETGAPFTRVSRLAGYARAVLDVPAGERVLLDGPWYHSAQLFFSLLSLLQGSRLVIRGRFDPAATLEAIDREQITGVHLVPTQFVRLLRLDEKIRDGFDGSSLAVVWHGAAPCSPAVKRAMIDWLGPKVHEYYGSTEASVNTVITAAEWLERPGSVGRPLPTTEVVVLRDDGENATAGDRKSVV